VSTVPTATARVVVTGMGVITSTATGVAPFARALREGARGMGPVTLFEVGDQKSQIGAEVKHFDVQSVLPVALRGTASRSDALGIVAADEAVRNAALSRELVRGIGIVVGGTTGGMLETEQFFAAVAADPSKEIPLAQLLSHPLSAPADHIAVSLGIEGPRRTVCTACSSSANAIAIGCDMLRRGEVRAVLVGGTDALCRLTYSGFNALGAMDANLCRPFDVKRAGLNLGEGAAFLVLERLEDATARHARIAAEVLGVGIVSEAHHITNPQATGEGAARAMRLALEEAQLTAADVDYVNAHGTGTQLNDAMESPAIRAVLGEHARRVYVSSTKSLVGHTLGAAGAIEAVTCLLAMEHGFVPPTAGLVDVDPKCELRHVPEKSVDARIDVCLSNSFGFGGTDSVVCLGRVDRGHERNAPLRDRVVVVTGLGATIATGTGNDAIDRSLARVPATASEQAPKVDVVGESLDPAKARRLNRFGRMATDSASQALRDAAYAVTDATRVGAALGTGWGSLDESAAFMRRVVEKGARLAPPADFPNLVLSAAVGHLSIYHGFRGPTLTASALGLSGEQAILLAAEEIVSKRADAMAAGGAEESNPVVLGLISRRSSAHVPDFARAPRAEGSAFVLLEADDTARARGARPIARIASWTQLAFAPPTEMSADVLVSHTNAVERAARDATREAGIEVDAVVTTLAYGPVRDGVAAAFGKHIALYEVAPRAGYFEALGAVAFAGGVRLVARGEAKHGVLVIGVAPAAVYAVVLARP
jgi:3-oxoacyl-[acyl-carrier-protein] synthase II